MATKRTPYFTVYPEAQGWRFMLWSANGCQLMEALRYYSTKHNVMAGARAAMRCFPGAPALEIFDGYDA